MKRTSEVVMALRVAGHFDHLLVDAEKFLAGF